MLPSETRAAVLEMIRNHPRGITAADIADTIPIDLHYMDRSSLVAAYYKFARDLERKGLVRRLNKPKRKGESIIWVIA